MSHPKITDTREGGATHSLRDIRPPGGHPGYAVVVVAEKRVLAVCKYYGRACEVAGKSGAVVVPATSCEKLGYKK